MQETMDLIVAHLDANGGESDWQSTLESVGYKNRGHFVAALNQLSANGIANRIVELDDGGKPVHVIRKVG